MSFGVLMYLPSEHIEECKSAEQKSADVPSGDLISRADTLAKIKEYCIDGDNVVQNWFDTMGIEEVIKTMPSVSADRQKGEWIENDALGWKCSKCGIITNIDSNFCPCCGADMRCGL